MTSINKFNPDMLISGDNSQRDNWIIGNGSSIYIKAIPDELNEIHARELFESCGTISKVIIEMDISGARNMSLHFHEWSKKETFLIQKIAKAFPDPIIIRTPKETLLKCYINVNPISKDDEIDILKDRISLLEKEVKKMKIEVLQRDEMINDIRMYKLKAPEPMAVERRERMYVRCPFYDEDIEIDPPEDDDW